MEEGHVTVEDGSGPPERFGNQGGTVSIAIAWSAPEGERVRAYVIDY